MCSVNSAFLRNFSLMECPFHQERISPCLPPLLLISFINTAPGEEWLSRLGAGNSCSVQAMPVNRSLLISCKKKPPNSGITAEANPKTPRHSPALQLYKSPCSLKNKALNHFAWEMRISIKIARHPSPPALICASPISSLGLGFF